MRIEGQRGRNEAGTPAGIHTRLKKSGVTQMDAVEVPDGNRPAPGIPGALQQGLDPEFQLSFLRSDGRRR